MALNVCNWNDRQLDELADLLVTADFSPVASFIAANFLCSGSRILTDPTNTTLRVVVDTDPKAVDISPGVFLHAMKTSQIDTAQVVNILNTTSGQWGTGKVAHGSLNRWSIICVKNNEQAHTAADRWFVNDTVDPNTFSTNQANTLINKAYYDIVVVHGTEAGSPTVPDTPAGYFTICEIYVPAQATAVLQTNIYDTVRTSQKSPANWDTTVRVLRMEYFAALISDSKFSIDHDPLTGYHRTGFHIGATSVGATVTAANLTKLTNGSKLIGHELHYHDSVTIPPAIPPTPERTGNGYIIFSSGLIMQWGLYVDPSGHMGVDQVIPITWPLIFPNDCFNALATLYNPTESPNTGLLIMNICSLTVSTGRFMSTHTGLNEALLPSGHYYEEGFYWQAVGY